jgi:hypothetical protein
VKISVKKCYSNESPLTERITVMNVETRTRSENLPHYQFIAMEISDILSDTNNMNREKNKIQHVLDSYIFVYNRSDSIINLRKCSK